MYFNPNTWGADVLEYQAEVVRSTERINFDAAINVIKGLYHDIGRQPPPASRHFLFPDPLTASEVYFALLLGREVRSEDARYYWNLYYKEFTTLARLSQVERTAITGDLTIANFGSAWGANTIIPSRQVRHNLPYIFDELGIKKDGPFHPRSMSSESMSFVAGFLTAHQDLLADGRYHVNGFPSETIPGVEAAGVPKRLQQSLYMDLGGWQFMGQNLYHLVKNGYRHPMVMKFLQLYMAVGAWIGMPSAIFVIDRPEIIRIEGPDAWRHSMNGPSIKWGRYVQYHVNNLPVPSRWITEGVNYREILSVTNQEYRRAALRLFGYENWLAAVGATELDAIEYNGRPYTLYRTSSPGGERIHILKVQDATAKFDEPTQTWVYQTYFLSVSTAFNTVMDCLTDTFGVTPDKYNLAYET